MGGRGAAGGGSRQHSRGTARQRSSRSCCTLPAAASDKDEKHRAAAAASRGPDCDSLMTGVCCCALSKECRRHVGRRGPTVRTQQTKTIVPSTRRGSNAGAETEEEAAQAQQHNKEAHNDTQAAEELQQQRCRPLTTPLLPNSHHVPRGQLQLNSIHSLFRQHHTGVGSFSPSFSCSAAGHRGEKSSHLTPPPHSNQEGVAGPGSESGAGPAAARTRKPCTFASSGGNSRPNAAMSSATTLTPADASLEGPSPGSSVATKAER